MTTPDHTGAPVDTVSTSEVVDLLTDAAALALKDGHPEFARQINDLVVELLARDLVPRG